MPAGGSANARVQTDKEDDKIWGDRIGELVVNVSIFAGRSKTATFPLLGRRGGWLRLCHLGLSLE